MLANLSVKALASISETPFPSKSTTAIVSWAIINEEQKTIVNIAQRRFILKVANNYSANEKVL